MQSYSISKQATPFNAYQLIFVALMILSGVSWGIPQVVIDGLVTMQIEWNRLYQISVNKSTKSKGATADRQLYFYTFYTEIVRVMDKYLITNTNVLITAANKVALKIKTRTGIKAPIVTPTTTPFTSIFQKESLAHHFKIIDSLTGKKARPRGVVFAELKYCIGLLPPDGVDNCTKNIFVASAENFVVFDAADKNKNAYYYGRWVNSKGQTGPFTLLFSAVIS